MMKIKTNSYGLVYKNRGKYTKNAYKDQFDTSKHWVEQALPVLARKLRKSPKDLRVVRVTLETVK